MLQDMVERLIVMSAPPGELWMKNQDADQKRRSAPHPVAALQKTPSFFSALSPLVHQHADVAVSTSPALLLEGAAELKGWDADQKGRPHGEVQ